MKKRIFSKRSTIDAPVEEVFNWHARPGSIERLSPPWDPLEVIERTGGIEKGAEVVLGMKAGPIPYKWHAKHIVFEENRCFADTQTKGPFSEWTHYHSFKAYGKTQSILEDKIEFALPFHPLGNMFAGRIIEKKLGRIFKYRHHTTIEDLKCHLSVKDNPPLTILVSGASGLIGRTLVSFLTTGGHRVVKLVRKPPDPKKDEVFWDPMSGVCEADRLDKIDAVIHLAGDNIGKGRWNRNKKKEIMDSRVKGTALVAETVSKLKNPPETFICASAIGYYGDRGDKILTEHDGPGFDFISKVCKKWEASAEPAVSKGIRTVFLRIGVVLSPSGGALEKMLVPFRLGLGGKTGHGSQYISWIGIDDVIGAVHHVLFNDTISGAVNIVSPEPVTNAVFAKKLGNILSRPAVCKIPEWAVAMVFGEMGRELLLSGTRVHPGKLMETGYQFRHPGIQNVLSHLLGLQIKTGGL